MRFLTLLGILAPTALSGSLASAQDTFVSPGNRLAEVTWTKDGTYTWDRPVHVRWVLVRACGGGGGGGGGYSLVPRPTPAVDGGTAVGGGGGGGAAVATTLLGPLTADRYTVVIGRGGRGGASKVTTKSSNADAHGNGGESGAPTSITGPDLSFETPGGVGGTVGRMQSRFSADGTMYEFFVTNAASSGGTYPGGGAAQNGARGLMGAGGAAGVEGYSGGGGGSIGSGGIGGKPENSGADGGICAGGGGAGFLRSNDSNSAGGNGGVGSLTLVSVATGEEER